MLRTSALSVLLLLATQLMPAPILASLPATDFSKRGVTAQEFKALAQANTSGQGGKRALLQSTAFSQNFYLILEAILEGNSGDKCRLVQHTSSATKKPIFCTLLLPVDPCASHKPSHASVLDTDGAASAIASASEAGDTTAIADAFSLSFAYGYAVPAAYAAATAIQQGSAYTCNNFAASAYISALSNAIAISSTEAAAQAIYAAFTLGW